MRKCCTKKNNAVTISPSDGGAKNVSLKKQTGSADIYGELNIEELRNAYIDVIEEQNVNPNAKMRKHLDLKKMELKGAMNEKLNLYKELLLHQVKPFSKSTSDTRVLSELEKCFKDLQGKDLSNINGVFSFKIKYDLRYQSILKVIPKLDDLKLLCGYQGK